MSKLEIGYSKVTGEYFVVDHDGIEYGAYNTRKEAEDRIAELELGR